MSPQKFVKRLPHGFSLQSYPLGFRRIASTVEGFSVHHVIGRYIGFMRWHFIDKIDNFKEGQKVGVKLPDGRIVIPIKRKTKES